MKLSSGLLRTDWISWVTSIIRDLITPYFFDLKTKIAGEILQKFSNYRIGLAIVGDFSKYESKSMKDFIFESNKTKHVNFVEMLEDALNIFSK
jgi:hypothetical protein